MRIIKNTSGYDTRAIKAVFTRVHTFMRSAKCEGKPAPNWKGLRVKIEGREDNRHSGRAFYGGHGYDWDIFLTLPRPIKRGTDWADDKGKPNTYRVRKLASLIYHELMHTYGYKHAHYNDIRDADLETLYPDNFVLPAPGPKAEPTKAAAWINKRDRLLARKKAWESKAKRAKNALAKIEKSLKYYARKYGD